MEIHPPNDARTPDSNAVKASLKGVDGNVTAVANLTLFHYTLEHSSVLEVVVIPEVADRVAFLLIL